MIIDEVSKRLEKIYQVKVDAGSATVRKILLAPANKPDWFARDKVTV